MARQFLVNRGEQDGRRGEPCTCVTIATIAYTAVLLWEVGMYLLGLAVIRRCSNIWSTPCRRLVLWWWVLLPYGFTILVVGMADRSDIPERKEIEKMERRKLDRVNKHR